MKDKTLIESAHAVITNSLTEGTNGHIGIIDKNGKIDSAYMHFDSAPAPMKAIISSSYKTASKVQKIVDGGANRGLERSLKKMEFYNDGTPNIKVNIKN